MGNKANDAIMIYDCFSFFNELDLLELRLKELEGVVDYHVLVESPVTHSGKPKRLFYGETKDRFEKWKKKIIAIRFDPQPTVNAWSRDHGQRNTSTMGILFDDDDLVLISDVDEIICAQSIAVAKWALEQIYYVRPVHFAMGLYCYYMNLRAPLDCYRAMMCSGKLAKQYPATTLRYSELKHDEIIPDGGWHFSYMGGREKVIEKMEAFAHFDEPTNTIPLEQFKAGVDPMELNHFRVRDVGISHLPWDVQNNLSSWTERGFIK